MMVEASACRVDEVGAENSERCCQVKLFRHSYMLSRRWQRLEKCRDITGGVTA
jgi:hypothetical protein